MNLDHGGNFIFILSWTCLIVDDFIQFHFIITKPNKFNND